MPKRESWLIIGADGMIGQALSRRRREGDRRVIGTTRRQERICPHRILLDLNHDVCSWCPPEPVHVAFLCAGVTSIEACRKVPDQTRRVNVERTLRIARRLLDQGCFVVFLSTNLVFDGTKPMRRSCESLDPRTEYGQQKAQVEQELLNASPAVSVLRLTKVLGEGYALFTNWMERLIQRERIEPFGDMRLAPIPLDLVIATLEMIGNERVSGVVQISAEMDVTYEQVARHLAHEVGADQSLITTVSAMSTGIPREALPLHTTLDTTRLRNELAITVPSVWQTIDVALSLEVQPR